MRLAALTVLLIGNILALQVHAEEIYTQPLTLADCGTAAGALIICREQRRLVAKVDSAAVQTGLICTCMASLSPTMRNGWWCSKALTESVGRLAVTWRSASTERLS